MYINKLLRGHHLPMISYASTSPQLSVKSDYPYFFRTVPSDIFQAMFVRSVLKEFQWTYVSIIAAGGSVRCDFLLKFLKLNTEYWNSYCFFVFLCFWFTTLNLMKMIYSIIIKMWKYLRETRKLQDSHNLVLVLNIFCWNPGSLSDIYLWICNLLVSNVGEYLLYVCKGEPCYIIYIYLFIFFS